MNRRGLCGWLTASCAAAFALNSNSFASAQTGSDPSGNAHQSNYASLVGKNREDSEKKMGKLGFKMKKPANDDRGSLWWNGATKECVELRGKNGRVKSIEPTSSTRCH